jgi:pimeloyl-ACP methyl ester carboxylesterase
MKNTTLPPYRSLMTLRTFFVRIIIAVLAALLVAACGPSEAPITVPAGAQAGDLVGLEPCTYEAGDVEYAADCGTLVVPENRSDPGSRLIALPFIRVRALNDTPAEPIFFLTGGPGQSNLHFQHLEGLIDNHDFVQVGYRGIEGSSVLDCPETVNALKLADDMLSEPSLDSFSASIARCAERLQSEGIDITGYTLLERVNDMEAARAALGYERINLLSQSVGTRTTMFYAQAYPEAIYHSVMIGVNPPGHFLWKAEVIDEQFEYYAELCAQDADCSARTDDLAETMRDVARDMPERWLFMPIYPGTVKLGSFFGLFNTSSDPLSAPWIIDAWLSAAEGDASGLAMISFFSDQVFPTGFVWGETAATPVSTDLPVALDYLAEANLGDSIIGTPGSTWMYGGLSSWPASLLPEEYRQVQPSDVETLLVGGTVDFSTPPRFARDEVLPSLSKGQQVILSEFGHTADIWELQPEATAQLITSFYDTGVADDSLFTHQPMDFNVGVVAFPEMAKLGLAIVVLVPLVLVALVWFIVRWVRRRRASQVSR